MFVWKISWSSLTTIIQYPQFSVHPMQSFSFAFIKDLTFEKCAVLRVSTRSCQPPPDYQIQNSTLASTSKQRDLGIRIASDLSWSHHYNCITSKAYRSLNLICRSNLSIFPHFYQKKISLHFFCPISLLPNLEILSSQRYQNAGESAETCH